LRLLSAYKGIASLFAGETVPKNGFSVVVLLSRCISSFPEHCLATQVEVATKSGEDTWKREGETKRAGLQ